MSGTAEYGAGLAGNVAEVDSMLLENGAAACVDTGTPAFAAHDPFAQEPVAHVPVLQVLQVLHLLHVLHVLQVPLELVWKSNDSARHRRDRIGNIGRGWAVQLLQPHEEQPLAHGAEAAAQVAQVGAQLEQAGAALHVEQAQGFGMITARGWQ
jgi:hypothetical protein